MGISQSLDETTREAEYHEPLEKFLKDTRSGDIVLFSGDGGYSELIKNVSMFSDFTHVGIIIRNRVTDEPFLLESTLETTPFDELTKTYKSGVKLVKAKEKILNYGGFGIAYRRLHTGLGDVKRASRLRKDWTNALNKFAKMNIHKPYEKDVSQLVGSILRTNNMEDESSYFCTELVAKALMIMDVLDENLEISSNYQLIDFATSGSIILKRRYYFGKLRYIN